MTDPVKATFKQENTDLAFISGGLTSLLQPLASLFKQTIQREEMDAVDGRWKRPLSPLMCG